MKPSLLNTLQFFRAVCFGVPKSTGNNTAIPPQFLIGTRNKVLRRVTGNLGCYLCPRQTFFRTIRTQRMQMHYGSKALQLCSVHRNILLRGQGSIAIWLCITTCASKTWYWQTRAEEKVCCLRQRFTGPNWHHQWVQISPVHPSKLYRQMQACHV